MTNILISTLFSTYKHLYLFAADRRSWTIHVLQSIEREKFEQTQREQETEEELEQQQLEDKYPGGIPEGHQHHHRQFKSNTARSTAAAAGNYWV
tara:strand:- start:101 stop:382 length:282 start_codon:yes stop_codon:yes gene_type:complete